MERKRLEDERPVRPAGSSITASGRAQRRRPSCERGGDLLKGYGVAVALAGLALTLRGVLPHPEGVGTYQLPLAAVVLSAWYGGRGPGLLASADLPPRELWYRSCRPRVRSW